MKIRPQSRNQADLASSLANDTWAIDNMTKWFFAREYETAWAGLIFSRPVSPLQKIYDAIEEHIVRIT